MNTKFILPLLLGIILPCLSFAKIDLEKFSSNADEFLQELEAYMTASHKEEMEPIFKEFEVKFRSKSYSANEELQIIELSNRMLEKKMAAKPFFSIYIKTITIIKKGLNGEKHFKQWHQVANSMIDHIESRKFNNYKSFLEFSFFFFDRGALRFSEKGVTWLVVTEDYNIESLDGLPSIKIEQLDLVCTRKEELIDIEGTSGVYFPLSLEWKGAGGKVSWERAELSDVYAELQEYTINTKKGAYTASKATLHYPKFFSQDVAGTFEDKILISKEPTYPRFVSSDNTIAINEIIKGVKFKGGFRLEGSSVYAVGTKQQPANLQIYNNENQLAINCTSEVFIIRKNENIVGESINTCLFIGQDSIMHPSSNLRFEVESGMVSLFRGESGRDRYPYFSSYHNMNMDIDRIDWDINTQLVEFGKKVPDFINANKRVNFTSLNYYSDKEFRRYQNLADYNPIAVLHILSEKDKTRIIDADYYAKKLNTRFNAKNIQGLLYDLTEDGFIVYDKEKNKIYIQEKIIHYSNASRQKTDFDNIKLVSVSEETNGILNLENNEMIVNGIEHFEFSKEHKIAAIPTGNQVVINEDCDLEWDGDLFAGYGLFMGRGYHFDYDNFEVQMDSVRFMDLYLPSGKTDKEGNAVAYAMESRLEYLSGILIMDAPENKSGTSKLDMFPIFNSNGPSYVYYDAKKTLNGCYHRDSFFFELKPFFLKDMDKEIQDDIDFKGTLRSAFIFPDIEETLLLQEDKSLGFVHNSPAEGYPLYQSKGHFTGEMSLSNKGLFGKGNVTYKWASVDAEEITFKPQQLLTSAQNFDVSEDRNGSVKVPEVKGYDVAINWKPYLDSMYIQSEEKPFEMFQEPGYTLENLLILTPDGIKGRGTFNSNRGVLSANLISFGAFSAESDTADLQIKASGVDHLALDTKNVFAKLDFDAQIGYVKANKENTVTTLPYNKYQTSMNEYDWDMANETITFKAKENQFGDFLSIHEDQDSLFFQGKTALYDLKSNQLQLGGVPSVQTSDALVYPDQGAMEIQPGGVITTLENAKITANTENKYHIINKATVNIKGKKEYTASGYYEYNVGKREQEIFFPKIIGTRVGKGKRSEKKSMTRASGNVAREDQFYIDHRIKYNGAIELDASKEELQFKGFAKLDVQHLKDPTWFSIDCEADKKNFEIRYDVPRNEYGDKIYTGLYLSREDLNLYPVVMQPLKFGRDRPIFETKGLLKYKYSTDKFYIGDSLRITSGVDYGNLVSYNDKDGSLLLEGKFNLGPVEDEMVNITAGGQMKTSVIEGQASQEILTMAGINFHLPKDLLSYITNDLMASSFDASIIGYRPHEFYEQALSEMITDTKTRSTQLSNIMGMGYMDIPKEQHEYLLFFDQLPLKWVPDYQSFVTTRSNLGLISFNKQMLNRIFETHIEFKVMTNGDNRVYIYIQAPSGTFYFFGYKDGILNTVSNNQKYNDMVENLKKKDRSIKLSGDEYYEIQLVGQGTANAFIQRVKAAK